MRQWRAALRLTRRDRIQIATPPSHILGLLNILTALRTGAWMRLHARFDIDRMLHHIESDRITVEMAVAPIALAIASHPDLESYDLSSLRFIMWGATPVSVPVAEAVTRRAGVAWVPAYGTTELPVIACNPIEGARLDTVGRPVPGVRLRVVSLENGEPVGPGEVGEIQARAPSLMAGYLPAEATAEAIRDGWYRTGDVGWLDAGGWLQDHRPLERNDQGARFPGRARRNRDGACMAIRPSKTVRCSAFPTEPTGRRSSPRSRYAHPLTTSSWPPNWPRWWTRNWRPTNG